MYCLIDGGSLPTLSYGPTDSWWNIAILSKVMSSLQLIDKTFNF